MPLHGCWMKLRFYRYPSSVLWYICFFDIEDLQYRGFYWFFRASRVKGSKCRLQLGTGVSEHRLQGMHFIATQFLAQDLKQYPVGLDWQRRRWSRGEGGVANGAAAAGGARTDLVQQKTSFTQAALCSWFHTGQDVSFYLQDEMHSVSR